MNTTALKTLRQMWSTLHFSTVERTFAQVPEDISSIRIQERIIMHEPGYEPLYGGGGLDTYFDQKTITSLDELPDDIKPRADVTWRRYTGVTTDGITFSQDDFTQLDLDIDLTLWFGERYGNHKGGYRRPVDGQLVCGEVVDTPEGKRYARWFTCDEAFKLMVTSVCEGTSLSEDELGRQLLAEDYPDMYWGIVRLFLFNNVQAFVDIHRDDIVATHPGAGIKYGKYGHECMDYGMWLPQGTAEYLHLLSWRFDTDWWTEFQQLAEKYNVQHSHPALGGVCEACDAERWAAEEFPVWYDSSMYYD